MQAIFSFEWDEIKEILISVFVIALAFTLTNVHASRFNIFLFAFVFVASVITVGTGFVFHEMAHKFVAQAYGSYARFMMWPQGLLFMFILSVVNFFAGFSFLFAAPGAVYIFAPYLSREENGKISLAGPATNFLLAGIFFLGYLTLPYLLKQICAIGVSINLMLALFNLIPIYPLDGSKVLEWNFAIWALSAGFIFLCYHIFAFSIA